MSKESKIHFDGLPINEIRKTVNEIAKDAGVFIKSQLNLLEPDEIQVKDYNSLVSYVDIEAEKLIVKSLSNIIPDAGFITEEDATENQVFNKFTWIIDPLDGTTNFIHRIPFFSVSIALKFQEEYILGVVYDVMHDLTFSASKGDGAYINQKRIYVSREGQLSEAVLATGFPYNVFESMEQYLSLFRILFQRTRGIRRLGSAALDLCYVASGSFTGFYEYGLNEWDIAAGICILKEAGGEVSDFKGTNNFVQDKTILATNKLIHAELLNLIKKHFV